MSTPYWGPDFDALAASDPDITGFIGTAIRDADGSRTAEVRAAVGELVGAHPAYPEPQRSV